jgi:hypothetical protein
MSRKAMSLACATIDEIYLSLATPNFQDTLFVYPINENVENALRYAVPAVIGCAVILLYIGQIEVPRVSYRHGQIIDRVSLDAYSIALWCAIGFGVVFSYPRTTFPNNLYNCTARWTVPACLAFFGFILNKILLRLPRLLHIYASIMVAGGCAFATLTTFPQIDQKTSDNDEFLGWWYPGWSLLACAMAFGGFLLWWLNNRRLLMGLAAAFNAAWGITLSIQRAASTSYSNPPLMSPPVAAASFVSVLFFAALTIYGANTCCAPTQRRQMRVPRAKQWDLISRRKLRLAPPRIAPTPASSASSARAAPKGAAAPPQAASSSAFLAYPTPVKSTSFF